MSKRSLRRELDDRGRYLTVAGGGGEALASHPGDPDYPEVDLTGMTLADAGREATRYYNANLEAARDVEHEIHRREDEEFAAAWVVGNLTVCGYLD